MIGESVLVEPISNVAIITESDDVESLVVYTSEVTLISNEQGPRGLSGTASITMTEVFYLAVAPGSQTIILSGPPGNFMMLFINGLGQSRTEYTISGNSLLLPPTLNIMAGDEIRFVFIG